MRYQLKRTAARLASLLATGLILLASCTESNDFSKDFDINWPVPKVVSISTLTTAIDQNLTITGENFEKLKRVTIGTPETEATIVSSTTTQIVIKVPRTATAGAINVYTNYKQVGTSSQIFTPIFPELEVTAWPAKISRGQILIVKGTNMDMAQEVEVDGTKIAISTKPGAATDQLSIPTTGITLPDNIVVKITKAKAGIKNGISPSIKVENPVDFFIPEAPYRLFDFETGTNPYTNYSGSTATSGLNASSAPKARDAKFLTVQKTAAVAWEGLGEFAYNTPLNLSAFHKPHLTFLVNTRNKDGYMQVEFVQDGTKWGMHFKGGNSVYDYNLKTNGWTWVSIELKTDNLEKWGGSGTSFNPNGSIDQITFGFKRGNGDSPDYEINIDELMITDGAQKPVYKAWDFEDNVNPYSGNAENGLNLSGIGTKNGEKYLTVKKAGAANWDWTGDIYKEGPMDLSTIVNPYVNFWVNTNGSKGFFQFETTQAAVKWGGNLNTDAYLVETTGWKMYSLRVADIAWSKWGGTGTATALDAKGVLDYLKIGFSTGNVAGSYEVNIDDIYISDGPMF